MDFPMILSGPIVRRVEPGLVAVQIVLREKCSVQLSLWEDLQKDENDTGLFGKTPLVSRDADKTDTIRVGDKLHMAVVMMKLTGDQVLKPGRVYSYNLTLTDARNNKHDLKSLGLLKDIAGNLPAVKPQLALGYAPRQLPSFCLPPDKLTELRIVHGSCRRFGNDLPDGQAWIDDLVRDNVGDANARPHQLLLSGDQIYADDVPLVLLPQMITRGQEMLAGKELLPVNNADGRAVTNHPADARHYPPAMRQELILSESRFTTVDNAHHLMSFGEFAAMYLLVWNHEIWQDGELQEFDEILAEFQRQARASGLPPTMNALLRRRDAKNQAEIPDEALQRFANFLFRDLTDAELKDALKNNDPNERGPGGQLLNRNPLDAGTLKPENLARVPAEARAKFSRVYAFAETLGQGADGAKLQGQFAKLFGQLREAFGGQFRKTIDGRLAQMRNVIREMHRTRRAMANVPTYMMFDDHEITDDWNLNPMWRDRVMTAPLGRAILRNGTLAYALFQAWGNEPEKYTQGKHKRLLEIAGLLYAANASAATQLPLHDELEKLFGYDRRTIKPDAFDEQLSWHYLVPGTRHQVLVIDNRTQRSWITRGGPPGNIMREVIDRQVPAGPAQGKDVLFVVAPLPVLGPPVFDELVAPLAYRAFDMISYIKHGNQNIKNMPGTNPDAIEAWAFDRVAMEAFLKRLEPYRAVILLSGDVHYGSGQALSYWKKTDTQPARFVQFTSSGVKNVMPGYLQDVDARFALAQRIIRAGVLTERLGWNAAGDHLTVPDGAKVAPALKGRLRETPAMVATTGWPEGERVEIRRPAQNDESLFIKYSDGQEFLFEVAPNGRFFTADTEVLTLRSGAKVTVTQVDKTIQQANGALIRVSKDGKSMLLPGNLQISVSTDGRTYAFSGGTEVVFSPGESRFKNAAVTERTRTLPGGVQVALIMDDRIGVLLPDQTKVYLDSDGSRVVILPNGTKARTEPDWSWRIGVLVDQRPDAERPEPVRPRSLPADFRDIDSFPSDNKFSDFVASYRQLSLRHQGQFDKVKHGRQVLFASNIGVIRFSEEANPNGPGKFLFVSQELIAQFPGTPKQDKYAVHKALLKGLDGALIPEDKPRIGGQL
ncbi:MAG: hypothetical protein ACKV2V_25465 [Blastocatellia bacterium]